MTNTTPTSATSISLSITNATGCPSGSNHNTTTDICLNTADSGGLVTGSHTLNVSGDMPLGYSVTLATKQGSSTSLVNNRDNSLSIPTITKYGLLTTNTWGYSLTKDNVTNNLFNPIKPYGSGDTVMQSDTATTSASQIIYYGANTDEIGNMVSGSYQATVEYTATARLSPPPTIRDMVPNSSWTDNVPDTAYGSTTTITGKNLASVTGAYVDLNNSGTKDAGEEVTNFQNIADPDSSGDNKLTFVAPSSTTEGQHDVYLEWEGGIVLIENGWNYIAPSVCQSGNSDNDCQVDIDANMIPVKYTGDEANPQWTAIPKSKQENSTSIGNWYDYSTKQWANAVTVKDPSKYTSITNETVVQDADILGYWVYVPRYAYEVMRRGAVDRVQQPEDFKIKFQKASDTKLSPVAGCTTAEMLTQDKDNGLTTGAAGSATSYPSAKSYRVGCGNSRVYLGDTSNADKVIDTTTWATHPAFTWTYTKDVNGFDEVREYNGIWVGKFEATGTRDDQMIRPNEVAAHPATAGDSYTVAKSLGVGDNNNLGGNQLSGITQNSHHLSTAATHAMKNSEWGAITYLSTSRYGAGVNKVQINANASYITGCGPAVDGEIGATDTCNAFNTSLGKLASTTNNATGIYDMVGGSHDAIAGNLSGSTYETTTINTQYFANQARAPYVNIYSTQQGFDTKVSWASGTQPYMYNFDTCTWATCGGHALHETKNVQSVTSNLYQSWGQDNASLVYNGSNWMDRGGDTNNYNYVAGLFYSGTDDGNFIAVMSTRVVLITIDYK